MAAKTMLVVVLLLVASACTPTTKTGGYAEGWDELGSGLYAKNDPEYGVRCYHYAGRTGTFSCVKTR